MAFRVPSAALISLWPKEKGVGRGAGGAQAARWELQKFGGRGLAGALGRRLRPWLAEPCLEGMSLSESPFLAVGVSDHDPLCW